MKKNLIDTFSILGIIVVLALALAVIAKVPVIGFAVFMFITLYTLVALANAASND